MIEKDYYRLAKNSKDLKEAFSYLMAHSELLDDDLLITRNLAGLRNELSNFLKIKQTETTYSKSLSAKIRELEENLQAVSTAKSNFHEVMQDVVSQMEDGSLGYVFPEIFRVENSFLMKKSKFYERLNLSKSRGVLEEILSDLTDQEIAKFINGIGNYKGHRKLFLEEGKIKSKYYDDFGFMLNHYCDNDNFRDLVAIVQKKELKKSSFCAKEVLLLLINWFNNRLGKTREMSFKKNTE